MARFNASTFQAPQVITNKAGGRAYKQSDKGELAAILVTNFLTDQYYRSAGDTIARVRELVARDPRFAAKAAIYARDEFNMRSITHVVAGEIAMSVKGETWTKNFFDQVIIRPDDMLEILAYIEQTQGSIHPVPKALRKGFAKALARQDAYRLAKYRGEGKSVKMRDVVNLVRPVPTDAIDALMKGTLAAPDTWEVGLTKAGSDAKAKARVWKKLLDTDQLGYMALLRNLRNIRDQASEYVLDMALERLVDGERVRKSRVLPFRFTTAIDQFSGYGQSSTDRKIVVALNKALDESLANVPVLPGKTAVLIDVSGSMGNLNDSKSPLAIGSLFAAASAKVNNADLIAWATDAKLVAYNPGDTLHSIREGIARANVGHGTDLSQAINKLREKYDRVIIFSDFQSWADTYSYYGSGVPAREAMDKYRKRTGAKAKVFSFDLAGYGELQMPERDVFTLAGFSEKVFDLMALLESDRKAFERAIEAVELA